MGWKTIEKLIRHWKLLIRDNVMKIRGKTKCEIEVVKRVVRSQNRVIVEGNNLVKKYIKVGPQYECVKKNRVIVEGNNLVKKHIKVGPQYECMIFTVEASFHVSNVQVLDPVIEKRCKVWNIYLEDKTKVRSWRDIWASGSIIPRFKILKIRVTSKRTIVGLKDTSIDLVINKTYNNKNWKRYTRPLNGMHMLQ